MKTTGMKFVVFVLVLIFLQNPARGDAEVSCVFMESCILPCSFRASTDLLIHWIQETPGNAYAHSYYHDKDQLTYQHQRFRNRTSLFKDQLSSGNASLQLTGVKVQDQGRYQCYTSNMDSSEKKSYINLKVDALVRKVDIQLVGNRITCSSEGIYPEPELTWSTDPPSNMSLNNTPTVEKNDQLLYNISSSLIVSDSVTDLVYSCNVSTRTNWTTETLAKPRRSPHVETQLNAGAVAGIVVAILVVVAITGLAVYCIRTHRRKQRRKRKRNTPSEQASNHENSEPTEMQPLGNQQGQREQEPNVQGMNDGD